MFRRTHTKLSKAVTKANVFDKSSQMRIEGAKDDTAEQGVSLLTAQWLKIAHAETKLLSALKYRSRTESPPPGRVRVAPAPLSNAATSVPSW